MSVNILTQNGLQRIHTVRVQKDSKIRENDVNFYDYDGTLVNSYTKTEFLALSALPPNPSHNGLTAQGWNWSLSDAKSYVNDYGKLNIGQMYITSDGKTRIYIHLEEGRLNPELNLTFVESGSFTVDWGDGTEIDTVSGNANSLGTKTHIYASGGDYVITINVITGKLSIEGQTSRSRLLKKINPTDSSESSIYNSCITNIRIGNGIANISNYAFCGCYSLVSITIPNDITNIGIYAFCNCTSLTSIIIPSEVIRIDENAFAGCVSIKLIALSNKITNIGIYAFSNCCSLISILLPNSLTGIGNSLFNNCYALSSVIISEGITYIASSAFSSCYSLVSLIIPNSVIRIGAYAISGCRGLGFIKFKPETPPQVSDSYIYSNLPTDCIIYVPQDSLSAYTSKWNYPNPNTYTYIEY